MKKTIFNNLFNEISLFFLITSLTLTMIVWILQAVNFLDIVSEDGHSIATYFSYSILNIPKIYNKLLLLSYFISLYYIISLYEDKNQIIIFWINGVSKLSFLNKIISLSLIFCIISFLLSFFLVPYTQNQARSFIRTSSLDFFPSLIKPRKFIDTVENFTIYLNDKDENNIERILIKDASKSENSQIIIAKSGAIIDSEGEKFLNLNDGIIINSNKLENVAYFDFNETSINLGNYKTKTTVAPKIQEINSKILIKCFNNLFFKKQNEYKINNLNCNQSFLENVMQELYKRIFLPLYIPIISIIACFLILKSNINIGFKLFKIKIFLIGIFIITLSQISINTITLNIYSGIITILLPLFLFFMAYVLFYNQMKQAN